MNELNSGNLNDLKPGDSLLTRVRMINKDKANPAAGKYAQIELAEVLTEKSLLSQFLPNDDRIIKPRAQRAWSAVEPAILKELFNIPEDRMNQINALPVSTGIKDLKEGVHYVNVNIKNPSVKGDRLRVQVVETFEQLNDAATPKINPSTQQPVLSDGKLVYRTTNIVNYKPINVFKANDRVEVITEVITNVMAPNKNVAAAMK